MSEFSVGVALFDFLPVLVSATALVWLASGIRQAHPAAGRLAFVAAALITSGGLCKASWKLLIALGQPDLAWLNNMLFLLLAPGFMAMAVALHTGSRQFAQQQALSLGRTKVVFSFALPWLGVLLLNQLYPDSRHSFFWLLALTTLANACLLFIAVGFARRQGLSLGVPLALLYSFAATLALSGLSRLPDGEMTAWIQESTNLSAQLAVAYGFWHIQQHLKQGQSS